MAPGATSSGGTDLRIPQHGVAATTTAAGLILTSGADGRSSYAFTSFQIRTSPGGVGTFYEGVVTKGYSTDEADDAVQANIVAAGYGKQ